MKVCTGCLRDLPLESFHNRKKSADGKNWRCSDYTTAYHREWRVGVSQQRYDEMWESQNFGCAVCGSDYKPCVDHDHKCCSGKRSCGECARAILCHSCNVALGLMQENAARIRGLALYAEVSS